MAIPAYMKEGEIDGRFNGNRAYLTSFYITETWNSTSSGHVVLVKWGRHISFFMSRLWSFLYGFVKALKLDRTINYIKVLIFIPTILPLYTICESLMK